MIPSKLHTVCEYSCQAVAAIVAPSFAASAPLAAAVIACRALGVCPMAPGFQLRSKDLWTLLVKETKAVVTVMAQTATSQLP